MTAGIGHNSDPAIVVRDILDDQHAALLTAVRDACREPAPETIVEHADAARITARIGALINLGKKIDDAHKTAKAPHIAAGRAVDAWKYIAREPLDKLCDNLKAALADYQRAIAEQERRRRQEQAQAARQYADMSGDTRADYLATSMEANAAAPDADMSRVRTRTGATASLRTTWDFEIAAPNDVPRKYLMVNDTAVRAAVRAGVRDILGIRIFERQTAVVRA